MNDETISELRVKTHAMVDKMMDDARALEVNGSEDIATLKEKAVAVKENVHCYIKTNPEKSVLIAAGLGVVAGALIATMIARKK